MKFSVLLQPHFWPEFFSHHPFSRPISTFSLTAM